MGVQYRRIARVNVACIAISFRPFEQVFVATRKRTLRQYLQDSIAVIQFPSRLQVRMPVEFAVL